LSTECQCADGTLCGRGRTQGRYTIDARELRRLIAEDDEGQFLEFKPADERPSSLATSLAAFANAEGGTLIVGIAERTLDGRKVHVIEGVPDVKLAIDHLYTAAELCTPKFELPAPERLDVDGRTVLVVTVPEGLGQVYGVEGHYLAREGSHRRALTPEEIRTLLSRRGLFAFDRQPVPGATRDRLDPKLVRAFVSRFRSGRRMDAEALLESRELLVRPKGAPTGPLVPSVAGLLLLCADPQRFFPQARVAVVQYADTKMGESFLKREIEGPVPAQLEEAEAWLARATLRAVELRGMGRTDREEYPREALREAVLNALAHRDYSLRGDRIRIYAFSDRMEVHSPGGLGGPMRLENLLEKRWSRNATLVQGLVTLDIIEELGFGLDRMVAAMAAAGLPAPVFANNGDTFVVTLYGAGASLLKGSVPERSEEARARSPALDQPRRRALKERHSWVLDYLRTVGPISTRAYAEAMGVSPDTALNDLRALARRGLVDARGTTRDRQWVLRREPTT
jgi:ATP-dependent DNA helicase RecG